MNIILNMYQIDDNMSSNQSIKFGRYCSLFENPGFQPVTLPCQKSPSQAF